MLLHASASLVGFVSGGTKALILKGFFSTVAPPAFVPWFSTKMYVRWLNINVSVALLLKQC